MVFIVWNQYCGIGDIVIGFTIYTSLLNCVIQSNLEPPVFEGIYSVPMYKHLASLYSSMHEVILCYFQNFRDCAQ